MASAATGTTRSSQSRGSSRRRQRVTHGPPLSQSAATPRYDRRVAGVPEIRGDFDELKKTLDAEIDSITLPETVAVPPAPADTEKQNEAYETEQTEQTE